MSWALNLAGDARRDFSRLDIWLQEEVLDEIDLLLEGADEVELRAGTHEVLRTRRGVSHNLILYLSYGDETHTLTVLDILYADDPSVEADG